MYTYAYIFTQQLTDFLGAHESLARKLGDIFCRLKTLLFPSLKIYFL
jgi:hypothetical protein